MLRGIVRRPREKAKSWKKDLKDFRHEEARRKNNPSVGLAWACEACERPSGGCCDDSHMDLELVWPVRRGYTFGWGWLVVRSGVHFWRSSPWALERLETEVDEWIGFTARGREVVFGEEGSTHLVKLVDLGT